MNYEKYVYVSPQRYYEIHKEWYYEYVIDGNIKSTFKFKYRQGHDAFKDIEFEAWRNNKKVRKLSIFEWNKLHYKTLINRIKERDLNLVNEVSYGKE